MVSQEHLRHGLTIQSSSVNVDASPVAEREPEICVASPSEPYVQQGRLEEEAANMWVVKCSLWEGSWYPSYYRRGGEHGQWERPPEMSAEWSDHCFNEAMKAVKGLAPHMQVQTAEPGSVT